MKTFKNISSTGNNLLLVDGLNMSFSFRGQRDFQEKYIHMIKSLQRSFKCSKVVVCVDKGSSSYRKALYPEYKYNRKLKQEAQTEQEQADFAAFFKCFEETIAEIENSGEFPVVRFQGVEADDSIAYISSKFKVLGVDHIWIVSSDRDLSLLVNKNVSQFSYVTRKEITLDNWSEHYEFSPDDYISIKCLMGDAGDNVLGVPGVGPKRAISLVEEYGSAYDIAASLPISSKYKYISNLNSFGAENIMLNYKLMDLVTYCDEALGEENCEKINTLLGDYL